jgi:transposase-like protein
MSASSAPAAYRFPRKVIAVAVRWYLRYSLSYRDVEELLGERGIEVDHVTIYRWLQTFTYGFIDAARASRHIVGDRWFVDETYIKVAGRWIYCIGRSSYRRTRLDPSGCRGCTLVLRPRAARGCPG